MHKSPTCISRPLKVNIAESTRIRALAEGFAAYLCVVWWRIIFSLLCKVLPLWVWPLCSFPVPPHVSVGEPQCFIQATQKCMVYKSALLLPDTGFQQQYILLARVRTGRFKARAGDISERICGEVPRNNALCFSEILCR